MAFHLMPLATARPILSASPATGVPSAGVGGVGAVSDAIVALTLARSSLIRVSPVGPSGSRELDRAHLRRRSLAMDGSDPRPARGLRRARDLLRDRLCRRGAGRDREKDRR